MQLHKLLDNDPADFALTHKGKVEAMVEVKCRTCDKRRFDTYLISTNKLRRLKRAAKASRCLPILLVEWTDALAYIIITDANYKVALGGRDDRCDLYDREPVAHLPIRLFVEC